MKIKKSESKGSDDEDRPARPDETQWSIEPFRDFDRWFTDFFQDFREEFSNRFWGPRWWSRSGGLALKTPHTDLKDTGKEFILTADMPGVSKEDIDITVHEDSVEIEAKRDVGREEEHEGYYYRERGHASYYRHIPLPDEVDGERAEGKLENGVLELTLPKLKPTEAKRHKVKLQ